FDMDVDGFGNLYLTQWSSTSVVRKISFTGIVSTIAGTGVPGFSGDGGNPLYAQLNMPHAVSTNPNGTEIFITDEQNKRIRKVDMLATPICPNTFSVIETIGPNGQLTLSHSISPQIGTPTYLGAVSGNPNLNPLPSTNFNTSGTYSLSLPGNGTYSYNSVYHDTISGFACTRNYSDTVLINNSNTPRKFNRKFNVSSTFYCNSGSPSFTDSTTFFYSLNNPSATNTSTTNWGNGSIVTNTVTATNQIIFSSAPTNYINPGAYLVQSIISGPGMANDTALATINVYLCGNVTGTLYNDINNNCTQDFWNNEFPVNQNIPMKLSSGSNTYFTWSIGGSYNFVNIPVGTYNIEVLYGTTGYTITCPGSLPHSTTVTATANTTENFAMNCTPGFDISASWISLWNGFFPGQNTAILPQVGILNGTCNFIVPGTVKMVLTPCISYVPTGSPANAPTYIIPASTGDTLVWMVPDINNLGNFNYWNYGVYVSTCTTAVVGDTACITVMVTPSNGDVNPNNNIVTRCFEIGVSYDPNYKEVEPKGQGPQGNIPPNTSELTYTIHFQNTGTAPALHVYLLDTIDVDLDLYTIEILGTSHYMQPYLLPGNAIKFMYAYINLPDSTNDEPNSHGYVTFRLKLKPGLPLGTQIKNTAYIYFDYNAPVITNTTVNTLALTTSFSSQKKNEGINIYPNPGDSKINVDLKEINSEEIIITDVLGKEIRRVKIKSLKNEIQTSDLSEGVYFIKLING
ncbi:MAG: T9SS type A sorting domain-containing protein, partial [Bacteroidota bacterium]